MPSSSQSRSLRQVLAFLVVDGLPNPQGTLHAASNYRFNSSKCTETWSSCTPDGVPLSRHPLWIQQLGVFRVLPGFGLNDSEVQQLFAVT